MLVKTLEVVKASFDRVDLAGIVKVQQLGFCLDLVKHGFVNLPEASDSHFKILFLFGHPSILELSLLLRGRQVAVLVLVGVKIELPKKVAV